mgnify:FL=1
MIPRHHRMEQNNEDYRTTMHFKVRMVLNVIFMLGVVAGMLVYFLNDKMTGMIILACCVPVKMAESIIRMMKK